MVDTGLAVTLEPVELLNDVEGDHEYVVAPVAVRITGEPLQMAVLGETVSATIVTVTVPWPVALQPFTSVPVTV